MWRRLILPSPSSTRFPSIARTRNYQAATVTADAAAAASEKDIVHDAIIVGGGPTGLLLSNLLSSHGIRSHLLFDKRPVSDLLRHPQAHFLNVRSMEILKAELPRVYERAVDAMPEVEEWEGFHFGGCVLGEQQLPHRDRLGGRRLGRVIHPVREPLRVGQRGDASYVSNASDERHGNAGGGNSAPQVSACRPGHLAQNKFVSLLLEEARRRFNERGIDASDQQDPLRYGEEVVHISEQSSDANNYSAGDPPSPPPIITVQTSHGRSYRTRYLLAADGVRSNTRQHFGIAMMGDECMQDLINIHFETNDHLSDLLRRRSSPSGNHDRAMLHFVYNAQLVGAFVCHDLRQGEWVLQIPFFPPFQTLEEDFDSRKVRDMIWAGLVGDTDTPPPNDIEQKSGEGKHFNFEIRSIRPWTMSSLVAQSYINDSGNTVLVGDAAHAFPPAGGFGMNTGLQDAHSLQWRLALLLNRERGNTVHLSEHCKDVISRGKESIEPSASCTSFAKSVLSKYDQERKPIATQNAALSVRNYQRTLRIAKACYLDAQHPQLLISLLNSPPANMLPMETRQAMFRKLMKAAMTPLGSLASPRRSEGVQGGGRSVHANHLETNVRSILESGGSLPLVFPCYELGFCYDPHDNKSPAGRATANNNGTEGDSDTAGYFPRLKVGHRMPHILVEVLASSPGSTSCPSPFSPRRDKEHFISLTDISSQLRRAYSFSSPVFTLISVGTVVTGAIALNIEAVNCATKKWNVPIILVNVLPTGANCQPHGVGSPAAESCSNGVNVLYTVDSEEMLLKLLHDPEQIQRTQNNCKAGEEKDDFANALIMVRPDGHIANVSWIDEKEVEPLSKQIQQAIMKGFQDTFGGNIVLDNLC